MYDLNINYRLLNVNLNKYEGVCINIDANISNYTDAYELELLENMYTRINVNVEEENINRFYFKSIPYYDIVSITVKDNISMEIVTGWMVDIISFDYINMNIKKGLIKNAINKGIFIEICIKDGLYNREAWIKNVYRVLSVTKGKNTIITTGAKEEHELKEEDDIKEFLKLFSLREERIEEIVVKNPIKLLRQAAIKRFSVNGIVNDLEEGNLKRKFILDEIKEIF